MDQLSITIECKPTGNVRLDELSDLQKNLKDLSEENYVKLRNSITEYGFSFPFYIWIDPQDGKKYIADGHQRFRVLVKMQEENIFLPPDFPAVEIIASDKKEAKKKLLLLNSQYGKISPEGLYEFANEPGLEIGDDIGDLLAIPEWDKENETSMHEEKPEVKKTATCPSCGTSFEL